MFHVEGVKNSLVNSLLLASQTPKQIVNKITAMDATSISKDAFISE